MTDIHAVGHSFAATRAEERLQTLIQQNEAREALLREEVAQWKAHRVWSDRILQAYAELVKL